MFCAALLASLLASLCHTHLGSWAWSGALPVLALYTLLTTDKAPKGHVMVTSLDDRSVLKYGAEYEALNAEQQADILSHYRVGNYLFPHPANEGTQYKPAARDVAHARRLLGIALAPTALLHGAAWHWLNRAPLDAAWVGVAAFMLVAVVALFAVPRILLLWNEPA